MSAPARFIGLLALGLGLGLGLGFAWFATRPAETSHASAPAPVAAPASHSPGALPARPALPPAPAPSPAPAASDSPASLATGSSDPLPEPDSEAHADIAAKLEAAALRREAASLPLIGPYLHHGAAAVRVLAREALLQLGLAEGAPLLRAAAAASKDPREAVALLDAAEYLELPPAAPTRGAYPKNLPKEHSASNTSAPTSSFKSDSR